MIFERLRTVIALLGASLAVGASSVRCFHLCVPDYALLVPGNPVDIHALGPAPSTPHATQQFDLPVTNRGKKPIRITGIRSACSCTVVGRVSGELIPPGETLVIPLKVDVPRFGTRTTSLTLQTSASTLPTVEVSLRLHGPEIRVPMIASNFSPVQFSTEYAGELVLHEFTVVTMEKLDAEPWLIGMSSSLPDSNVERLRVVDLDQYPELGVIRRRYDFLLRFIGPENEYDALAFAVEPESTVPSVPEAQPLHVRCQLAAQSVAAASP